MKKTWNTDNLRESDPYEVTNRVDEEGKIWVSLNGFNARKFRNYLVRFNE